MSDSAACASCGAQTTLLAMISDPFMDHCYYVCSDCLRPIHDGFRAQIAVAFEKEYGPGSAAVLKGEQDD